MTKALEKWRAEQRALRAHDADWMLMVEMEVCRNSFGKDWVAVRNEGVLRDAAKLEGDFS